MNPDYGLYHLLEGYDQKVVLHFYDVPFKVLGFIEPYSYTAMCNLPFNDTIYALSFDFSDDVLAHLLALLPTHDREQFGSSIEQRIFNLGLSRWLEKSLAGRSGSWRWA